MRWMFLIALLSAATICKAEARSGETIYQQQCATCHATGLAGAPKFREGQAWHDRLQKKDMNTLLPEVKQGYNAMPPMGTCQDCTDDELKAAIEYMAPK